MDATENNTRLRRFSATQCIKLLTGIVIVAVETAGVWNQSAIELIQEVSRRITAVTEDTRETVFLFQRLSIALQRGIRSPSWLHSTPRGRCFCLVKFHACGFVLVGLKLIVIIIKQ